MKKQTAISPFRRKGMKPTAAQRTNLYDEVPYRGDRVIDSAKDAIYKYESVVNGGKMPAENNSHIMHFDPTESSASTEQANRNQYQDENTSREMDPDSPFMGPLSHSGVSVSSFGQDSA